MSVSILENNVLPAWAAFLCAFVGSLIPCLPVMILTRKIKNRFITGFIQSRYNKNLTKLSLKQTTVKKLLLLSLFVAIPLPLTGVWSGSIIAGATNLKYWQCFTAIAIGSLIACSIILLVCLCFEGMSIYILYFSLMLLGAFLLFEIIKIIINKIKRKNAS